MRPLARIALAVAALSALGAGAFEGRKQWDRWQAGRPTQRNLEAAVKAILERQALVRHKPRGWALCARIPVNHPEPDARSRATRLIGWHADFIKDAPARPERVLQLRQLDALAGVGLVKKEDAVVVRGDLQLPAIRYSLTDKGWAASASGEAHCLEYGQVAYLGFLGAKEITYEEVKLQEVAVRIGIPGAGALAEWARDPAVQAAFPDIAKDLEGRRANHVLEFADGSWREFRPGGPEALPPRFEDLPEEDQRQLRKLAALPDPDAEELKQVIFAIHSQGSDCAHLPGSEKLPVDRMLMSNDSPVYRVGIYLDKPRASHDRVASKTLPLLEKLAAVGGLVRHPPQRVLGEGAEAGRVFDMVAYELSPQLQRLLPATGPRTCLPLGPRSLTLLDVKYRKADSWLYPSPSFTYKMKVALAQPPADLADPVLQSAWPDLRGLLEKGLACGGDFQFNKELRRPEAGSATCWHNFDSQYEER